MVTLRLLLLLMFVSRQRVCVLELSVGRQVTQVVREVLVDVVLGFREGLFRRGIGMVLLLFEFLFLLVQLVLLLQK
jgi:hypothetical protein